MLVRSRSMGLLVSYEVDRRYEVADAIADCYVGLQKSGAGLVVRSVERW